MFGKETFGKESFAKTPSTTPILEYVYVGAQSMATVKVGPSTESQLYVGTKDLFP